MQTLTRREMLALTAAGAALPSLVHASHEADWDWAVGSWDVFHRRLKDRLAGSTEWVEFTGKSSFWTAMGGLGNFDDNLLELPTGVYRGMSVRSYDPATNHWAIWWLDGRNPGHIEPPVRGGFKGDEGEFLGPDVFKGKPITVRFRWHEVHGKRPWWDQAFSTDGGKSWEINWRNYFTRTSPDARSQPRIENDVPEARAWDFLAGKWKVRNRRLRQRFAGSRDWDEVESTLVNRPVLGGRGNVGDNRFDVPGAPWCGMSLRAYDDEKKEWLSWWLDGRSPADIGPPMRGKVTDGAIVLFGDDEFNGKPVKARSTWTRTETDSPHWEQAESIDGGKTWEVNWQASFERA